MQLGKRNPKEPDPAISLVRPGFVIEDRDGKPAGLVTHVSSTGDVHVAFKVKGHEHTATYTAEQINAVVNKAPLPVDSDDADGEVLEHRWVAPANPAPGEQHMQRVRNGVPEPVPESPRDGGLVPWMMPPPGPGSLPVGTAVVQAYFSWKRTMATFSEEGIDHFRAQQLADTAKALGIDPNL